MAPAQDAETNENGRIGPHPSYIQVAKPYMLEQHIQECLAATGVTQAKEDNIRMLGVAWIDNVRKALQLPVRTYNTACVYYHKFRLSHADTEYGFIDAAAAALFMACKVEDTLKRSKEILCAAYNLKLSPAEHVSQDDPMFESPSKTIIGLERLMLESAGFDFRNRYPQKLVIKLAKFYRVDKELVGKKAYYMSLDLYRTFAPLKQTNATLAFACLELSGRVLGQNIPDVEAATDYANWHITREEVMETLLDLLDLYTHHRTSTIVGQDLALDIFIDTRIILNQEASSNKYPRYTHNSEKEVPSNGTKATNGTSDMKATKSPVSPSDPSAKDTKLSSTMSPAAVAGPKGRAGVKDGTIRFMLDPERAREEQKIVADYFKVEEEEYEVEVETERRRG